jgi:hypothetical protein
MGVVRRIPPMRGEWLRFPAVFHNWSFVQRASLFLRDPRGTPQLTGKSAGIITYELLQNNVTASL